MSTVCHKVRTLIMGRYECNKEEMVQSASSSVSKSYKIRTTPARALVGLGTAIADKLPISDASSST